MKRFLIYTIMAVLAAGVAPAQENEKELLLTGDLSLFDVRGPVKEITGTPCNAMITPEGDYTVDVRFDRKGRITSYRHSDDKEFVPLDMKNDFNKRDKDGNIASYVGLFEIGIAGTLYDIDGELVRYGFGLGNIDTYGSVTIIYNDRHDRIKAVADVMAFSYREVGGVWDETVRTMDYTITKRDSYGNWIERQCAYMGSTTNETRVITYYDTVPKPSKR